MSIKAEWRLAELDLGSDDPFDTVILSSGLRVDLRGTEEEITEGLRQSLVMEGKLWERGVTCDLKDEGHDCLTCDVRHIDPDDLLTRLCRLGVDQRHMMERGQELSRIKHAPYLWLAGRFAPVAELSEEYIALAEKLREREDALVAAAVG